MSKVNQDNKVFVVQAQSLVNADLELLGIFSTEERAQAFIDQAPKPQRDCLGVSAWTLNEHTGNEFWIGAATSAAEAKS